MKKEASASQTCLVKHEELRLHKTTVVFYFRASGASQKFENSTSNILLGSFYLGVSSLTTKKSSFF